MARVRLIKIRALERGLYFRDRELRGVLRPGRHVLLDPLWRVRVDVVSVRDTFLVHPDLEVLDTSEAPESFERTYHPAPDPTWQSTHFTRAWGECWYAAYSGSITWWQVVPQNVTDSVHSNAR